MGCLKTLSPIILPSTLIVKEAKVEAIKIGQPVTILIDGEGGLIVNQKVPCSTTFKICIVNSQGVGVGLINVENIDDTGELEALGEILL